MNIIELYKLYCLNHNITFQLNDNVRPYDDTTLFCPAGMQQFKNFFKNVDYKGNIANVQSCIRMNDFDELGDSTHLLYFNMIGLFSFRTMSLQNAIDFQMNFLIDILNLKIDYVTIHPDKSDWINLYEKYNINVVYSDECVQSDGEIGGYCTEFFIDGVEIGNIVNPMGDCIDVGFGLERLEMFINNKKISKEISLKETIIKIIDSGYKPSNIKQGYVLRKLLRELYVINGTLEHKYFYDEIERQNKIKIKYDRLKDRYGHMSKEQWFDTHGIDLDLI